MTCLQCGAPFVARQRTQLYCTPTCRRRWNKRPEVRAGTLEVRTRPTTCAVCAVPVVRSIRTDGARPTCSVTCRRWLQTGWPLACALVDRAATIANSKKPKVPKAQRDALLLIHAAYGSRCAYCDEPIEQPHGDHVVPWWLGGRNSINNYVGACGPCNMSKGPLTLEQWSIRRHDRPRRFALPATDPRFAHLHRALLTIDDDPRCERGWGAQVIIEGTMRP